MARATPDGLKMRSEPPSCSTYHIDDKARQKKWAGAGGVTACALPVTNTRFVKPVRPDPPKTADPPSFRKNYRKLFSENTYKIDKGGGKEGQEERLPLRGPIVTLPPTVGQGSHAA